MTMRLVATPLDAAVEWPSVRAGAGVSGILDAFIKAPGTDVLLARLGEPGALVVTTGQQPALFTGPLYTIYKALSAAALARVLEQRWDRPVVPVFWIAGDDHDYIEASSASWLTADGSLVTGTLPPRAPDAPSTPLYREPLGSAVDAVREELVSGLAPAEFHEWTVAWLRRHFQPAATFGQSFAGAIAELLAPAGVLCLESTHPSFKTAAAPYLLRALEQHAAFDAALGDRSRELVAAGRDPGVGVGDGATLVMLEASLGRDRLVADGNGFITRRSQERFDRVALERLAAQAPERFSPNVLLRPVVESALLPTVAYVAGPGELRYLALTTPLYERLGVTRQRPIPRWSGIIVERRVDRVLEKFRVGLGDLLAPAGPLESRLVRSLLPADGTAAMARLRDALQAEYRTIAGMAEDVDPTLAEPAGRAMGQAINGLDRLEKKLVQHLKRRQEIELWQLARARDAVFPGGRPQERVLTIASFLARHGPALIVRLTDEFEVWYHATLDLTASAAELVENAAGRVTLPPSPRS